MRKHQYGRYEVRGYARPIEGTFPLKYTGYVEIFDIRSPESGPIEKASVTSSKNFATREEAESTSHVLGWMSYVKFRQKYTEGPVPDFVFVIDKTEGGEVTYEATQAYPLRSPQIKVQIATIDRSNHEIADHLAQTEQLSINLEKFQTEWVGEGRYVRFYHSEEGKVVAVEDGERTIAVLRTVVV